MRRHGWQGDLPASDDEAISRILTATRRCIDLKGPDTGIADVAHELGVTRQTVYRYFRTTNDLLAATAMDAAAEFLDRVEAHLADREWNLADAVVESIAFTLERLPNEPYLGLLLTPGKVGLVSRDFTSPTALALGRSVVERFPVDWQAAGVSEGDLDEIVEQMLRITHSFIVDAGTPPRSPEELRGYLARWFVPTIDAHLRAR